MVSVKKREPRLLCSSLVEFPFWIGDTVEVQTSKLCTSRGIPASSRPRKKTAILIVLPVMADSLNPAKDIIKGKVFYRVGGTCLATPDEVDPLYSPYGQPDFGWYVPENGMALAVRGPLWHFFHGRNFDFRFVGEWREFLSLLGPLADAPHNPRTNMYAWPLEQALEQVTLGNAHLFDRDKRFFPGSGSSPVLVKFQDDGLGAFFQEATLRKYKLA